MLPDLELVYWPIRGRAYPALLMLKAARVPFKYTEATFDREQHHGAKQRGEINLDRFPFGALPVLEVSGPEGKAVIAETSAILRYLENVIRKELAVNQVDPPSALDQAWIDMLHSAALFNSTVLYNSAANPKWLEGEERAQLKRERVLPFLRGLEHQLTDTEFARGTAGAALRPVELHSGGVLWSAAACAIAYTLSMVCDVFPLSLAHPLAERLEARQAGEARPHGTLEDQFPACAAVLRAVEGSPGCVEWIASGERKERWSNWPSFTPEKVMAAAQRWDREP